MPSKIFYSKIYSILTHLKTVICIPIFKYTLLNYTWADCSCFFSKQVWAAAHCKVLSLTCPRALSHLEEEARKIVRKLSAHTPKGSQGRLEIN